MVFAGILQAIKIEQAIGGRKEAGVAQQVLDTWI